MYTDNTDLLNSTWLQLGKSLKTEMDFLFIWSKFEFKKFIVNYYRFFSELKEKQWDHPKFEEIRQWLDECNYVKYSMYRVALKFRVLQSALYSKY